MKKILQHPITMFILRKIPLFLRYKLKEKLEKKSHAQTGSKPDYIYLVVDDSIAEYITKHQADAVIHGHTHRPGYYSVQLADGKIIPRYEIPDWEDNPPGGYIIAEDSKIMIDQV
jgi:UDP-2,3-diacylglucosamine hydrolase